MKETKKKFSLFLLALIILLVFANLIASNRLSTAGGEIKALEIEKKKLSSESASLELEIPKTGSISGVIKRAENLGFIASSKVLYLKGESAVAMK